MVVVWKDLEVTRCQRKLFDDDLCFFYITNDKGSPAEEIVFRANDACDQENLIQQHKNGVHTLTAPVDNLVSNWAYMVMASCPQKSLENETPRNPNFTRGNPLPRRSKSAPIVARKSGHFSPQPTLV